ncbi:MAG: MBL fold metallo-hydrolase [Oscillospiraceae bacterium]
MLYHLTLGPLATNTYILTDENNLGVIFDPAANPSKILKFLDENQIDLKAILLTHGHYDHIGAVGGLLAKIPNLKCYINREDTVLTDKYKNGEGLPAYLHPADYAGLKITDFVADGDIIKVGDMEIKAIATPGHTLGGMTYASEGILFTGDTLFKGSMGRSDLYGGDEEEIMHSLKKIYTLKGDFGVCPGHEGASQLSVERETNPYMRLAVQ